MNTQAKPRTADTNGRLWGRSARDWSELMEPLFRPVYATAFDRAELRDGAAYLDVGCGADLAAQAAAERGARVCGLDAAQDLLAVARVRVPAGEFHHGDLEQLPFAEHRFDLVSGFNSFQYAGNPVAALREARRVSRPGASVLIATWGQPDGMQAASLIAALRPLLPPPPAGAPGPFALSEEATLRAFAAEAGLAAGEVFDIDAPWHFANLATALRALKSSGVGSRAIEHAGEQAVDDAHAAALAPFRQADDSYLVSASFRCLLAAV